MQWEVKRKELKTEEQADCLGPASTGSSGLGPNLQLMPLFIQEAVTIRGKVREQNMVM